jgi:chromate reductase
MKILGLCGSLRSNSSNGNILKAAKALLSPSEWREFNLSELPYFDPDNQFSERVPVKVKEVRQLACESDVIFVSTPEYAHGLPGILKNAFEWIFHEGTQKKPVYVVIGSAEGENTKDQLVEILKTMDFKIDESHVLLIKGARSKFDESGRVLDTATEERLNAFLQSLTKYSRTDL